MCGEVLLLVTYAVRAIVSDYREYSNLVYFDGLYGC